MEHRWGESPNDWCEAVLRRPNGDDERRRLLMLDDRPPGQFLSPITARWFEVFTLTAWQGGSPVYNLTGYQPRD